MVNAIKRAHLIEVVNRAMPVAYTEEQRQQVIDAVANPEVKAVAYGTMCHKSGACCPMTLAGVYHRHSDGSMRRDRGFSGITWGFMRHFDTTMRSMFAGSEGAVVIQDDDA